MLIDIGRNIDDYLNGFGEADSGRGPLEEAASFDYCFNYFRTFHENGIVEELHNGENIENSCLQLSFFLASWGMYRGTAFVTKKSSKFYERLIRNISQFDEEIWDIDIDNYNIAHNIDLLLQCKEMIKNSFNGWNGATDIFISKIMLGVFGNVPAFDTYLRKGSGFHALGINSLCRNSLNNIHTFYTNVENEALINEYSTNIHTLDFNNGGETEYIYSKAKIIDMVLFIEGWRLSQ